MFIFISIEYLRSLVNAKPTVRVSSWAALHCALCSDEWTRRIHWIFYYCNLRLNKLSWQMPCSNVFNKSRSSSSLTSRIMKNGNFRFERSFQRLSAPMNSQLRGNQLQQFLLIIWIRMWRTHNAPTITYIHIWTKMWRFHPKYCGDTSERMNGRTKERNLHQHIALCATSGDNDNNDFNSIQLSNWNWVQRNRARAIRIHHRRLSVQRP